jgi:hypothetical protein
MAFMRRIKLVLGVATVMAAMLAASAAPAMARDFSFNGGNFNGDNDLRGGDGVNRIVSSHNVGGEVAIDGGSLDLDGVDFDGVDFDGDNFGDFLAFDGSEIESDSLDGDDVELDEILDELLLDEIDSGDFEDIVFIQEDGQEVLLG